MFPQLPVPFIDNCSLFVGTVAVDIPLQQFTPLFFVHYLQHQLRCLKGVDRMKIFRKIYRNKERVAVRRVPSLGLNTLIALLTCFFTVVSEIWRTSAISLCVRCSCLLI